MTRTTYRPDPWLWPEWVVAGCGVLTAVVFFVTSSYDPLNLTPVISPLAWPTLPLVPTLAVLLCGVAGGGCATTGPVDPYVPTGRAGGPRAGARMITFDQVTVTYVDAGAAGAA